MISKTTAQLDRPKIIDKGHVLKKSLGNLLEGCALLIGCPRV
jgi:hypothetical protein